MVTDRLSYWRQPRRIESSLQEIEVAACYLIMLRALMKEQDPSGSRSSRHLSVRPFV